MHFSSFCSVAFLLQLFSCLVCFCSPVKAEVAKKQDVMTLSDSDDVQTISSGSEDNKEKEKATPGKEK